MKLFPIHTLKFLERILLRYIRFNEIDQMPVKLRKIEIFLGLHRERPGSEWDDDFYG